MLKIPVVDLKFGVGSSQGKKEDYETLSKEIEEALSGVGFVYLVNHGIPNDKIEQAFAASKTFFELPQELKVKYRKDASKGFHGYVEPGQELLNENSTFEIRETFDIPAIRVDSFPEEVPDFKVTLLELKQACHPLIDLLNRILARSLKLEDGDYFYSNSKWMRDDSVRSMSSLRSLYYPPIRDDSTVLPGTVRCAEHTDYGTLTLLFQDSIGGLQVKTTDDKWIAATPIPGSILVNTGDLLEFWSSGYFPATKHRVLIPEIELKKRIARQSIVYFVHPDDDTIVAPLKNGTFDDKKYQEISAGKHALMKLNATYQY
ncbi:unnamed protein product [Allacma fusca]|uniref:Fe2OG dioxygenase domain-containing protein n=1 Tax=Allacma fusca TaxID=39272 RepID=A0A8J2P7J1_9HEXA|nr:unnamed protein product [Allacma fusca]